MTNNDSQSKRRASIKLTISKDYANPNLTDEQIKSDIWLQMERCLNFTSAGLVIDLNHKILIKVRKFQ
jgi:hypothetical protein